MSQSKLDSSTRVLMIDNYDSFTFNLVHYLEQLDVDVIVKKNDEISLDQINNFSPTHIIISPGPCAPNQAGISLELVERFKRELPILGVCLGHQAIGQSFGGKIIRADKIMHGMTSKIYHNSSGMFSGLPQGLTATRYHSLVIDPKTLPNDLSITAWTQDAHGNREAIMGIQHKRYNVHGVQFHPESVLSECGIKMLSRFLHTRTQHARS